MAVLMVVVAEAGEGAEVCLLCALFHVYEPYVCRCLFTLLSPG